MPVKVSRLERWESAREHTLLALNEMVRGNIENQEQVAYHLRQAAQLLEEDD